MVWDARYALILILCSFPTSVHFRNATLLLKSPLIFLCAYQCLYSIFVPYKKVLKYLFLKTSSLEVTLILNCLNYNISVCIKEYQ